MVKIIFVCYNHGTGGETLSQKISLLEQCNNLTYKKFNERTITNDVFKGTFRYDKFSQQPLPDPSDKWYVVPSHFPPEQLVDIKAIKFYVVINDPITTEHDELMNKNIYKKVWARPFHNILEIKGQIEADGHDPRDPYFKNKIKGGITYGELRCLYKKEAPTKENIRKHYKIFLEKYKRRERFQYKEGRNLLTIAYADTLDSNFYQTFTKKLSMMLT